VLLTLLHWGGQRKIIGNPERYITNICFAEKETESSGRDNPESKTESERFGSM